MDKGLLPRRYAKALYKFADQSKSTGKIYALMQNVANAFESNRDLQTAIANPYVTEKEKSALIETAAGEKNAIIADFVKLLSENNRLDIVRAIALAYTELYRRENHIHLVEITSAAQLNDKDRRRLEAMVEKHIGDSTSQFTFNVDPDLIGGFVVKIDNESLDASVRNELRQLRETLIN